MTVYPGSDRGQAGTIHMANLPGYQSTNFIPPIDGAFFRNSINYLIGFDEPVQMPSLEICEISIFGLSGAIIPSEIIPLTSSTFEVLSPITTVEGSYTITVDPNITLTCGSWLNQDLDVG